MKSKRPCWHQWVCQIMYADIRDWWMGNGQSISDVRFWCEGGARDEWQQSPAFWANTGNCSSTPDRHCTNSGSIWHHQNKMCGDKAANLVDANWTSDRTGRDHFKTWTVKKHFGKDKTLIKCLKMLPKICQRNLKVNTTSWRDSHYPVQGPETFEGKWNSASATGWLTATNTLKISRWCSPFHAGNTVVSFKR